MSYPYQEFIGLKHRCQHRLGLYETYTTDYDTECIGGCKCGDHWNEIFENKPTAEETEAWAEAFYIKGLQATQIAEDRRRALFAGKQEAAQIITLSFDKAATNVIELMDQALAEIQKANYAWLDIDAIYAYEFYSDESKHKPENPHCHIATKRMVDKKGKPYKATNIAQQLRRKFGEDSKTPIRAIYRVNGEERTWKVAKSYVDGSCASKSPGTIDNGWQDGDKWRYTKQDIVYRAEHGVQHPMDFKAN
ncbi:MAG: putative replicase [Circoviridae sp.]|nr:MAG: putative replicase [Circoviridae sp.]